MPTYDYECSACGHAFEKFQSITAPSIRKCPECKKLKVRRLSGTGAGIIFKGSGFYETDYKRKSSNNGNSSKSTSANGSSESKPETEKPAEKKPEKASKSED